MWNSSRGDVPSRICLSATAEFAAVDRRSAIALERSWGDLDEKLDGR